MNELREGVRKDVDIGELALAAARDQANAVVSETFPAKPEVSGKAGRGKMHRLLSSAGSAPTAHNHKSASKCGY